MSKRFRHDENVSKNCLQIEDYALSLLRLTPKTLGIINSKELRNLKSFDQLYRYRHSVAAMSVVLMKKPDVWEKHVQFLTAMKGSHRNIKVLVEKMFLKTGPNRPLDPGLIVFTMDNFPVDVPEGIHVGVWQAEYRDDRDLAAAVARFMEFLGLGTKDFVLHRKPHCPINYRKPEKLKNTKDYGIGSVRGMYHFHLFIRNPDNKFHFEKGSIIYRITIPQNQQKLSKPSLI